MDSGTVDCVVRTRVIGLQTTYPIGLIALHGEIIKIHRAKKHLLAQGVYIDGICVDGIHVREEFRGALETYAASEMQSGQPIFKIKDNTPAANVPKCLQSIINNGRRLPDVRP